MLAKESDTHRFAAGEAGGLDCGGTSRTDSGLTVIRFDVHARHNVISTVTGSFLVYANQP